MSVPAFYGAELRWKREAAGLTLQELAHGNFYSIAYLSQIELGDRRMPLDLAQHADQVLRTDGFFQRRCEDVRKARRGGHAEYFADVAEMEKSAATLEEWAPILIPGLLQTADYLRRLIRVALPRAAHEEVEGKVSARLSRAELFSASQPPEFWAILDEAVIRRPVLPPQQMAEQLEYVADRVRQVHGVLQIVPLNVPSHPFMTGTARIMTFKDAPAAVYTEGLHSGQLIDDPGLVEHHKRSYDLLRAAALPPEASLAIVDSAAEGYRND